MNYVELSDGYNTDVEEEICDKCGMNTQVTVPIFQTMLKKHVQMDICLKCLHDMERHVLRKPNGQQRMLDILGLEKIKELTF